MKDTNVIIENMNAIIDQKEFEWIYVLRKIQHCIMYIFDLKVIYSQYPIKKEQRRGREPSP